MKITLTLEDEIVVGLKQIRKLQPEKTFEEIVNLVLKSGLVASELKMQVPFKIKPIYAIPKAGVNFDNIAALISFAEGDFHK